MPISKNLLEMILRETKNYFLSAGQPYLCRLYRALFAAFYYGLLRVGELTSGDHPVWVKDVQIMDNKDKMLFILRTSKTHWSDVRPQTVKIVSTGASNKFSCPFQILREYADVRRTYNSQLEPFFVFRDRTLVRPPNMRSMLRLMLERNKLDPLNYNVHGFRFGRASDLLKNQQISIADLKRIGRWR